jgi:hypothetical protein
MQRGEVQNRSAAGDVIARKRGLFSVDFAGWHAVVFRIVHDNQHLLAVRSLDRLDSQVLAGTEGGRWPFWAPDSREPDAR